jgi:hypothetical protein
MKAGAAKASLQIACQRAKSGFNFDPYTTKVKQNKSTTLWASSLPINRVLFFMSNQVCEMISNKKCILLFYGKHTFSSLLFANCILQEFASLFYYKCISLYLIVSCKVCLLELIGQSLPPVT